MDLKPNFKGEGVPSNIKQVLDSLPQEYFYPTPRKQQTTLVQQQQNNNEESSSQLKQIVNAFIKKQFSNESIKLAFPEPNTLIQHGIEMQKKEAEQKQKLLQEESEKERKRSHVLNVARPKREARRVLYEESSHRLTELQKELLQNQPTTLLSKLYRPGIDSPYVLNMLHNLEHYGKLVADPDKEPLVPIPQEYQNSELRSTNIRRQESEDREKNDIKLHLSTPDVKLLQNILRTKGFAGLNETLAELNEQKKRRMKELEEETKLQQLLFVLKMYGKLQTLDKKDTQNPWMEYLQSNFIQNKKIIHNIDEHKESDKFIDGDIQYVQLIEELEKLKEQKRENDVLEIQSKNPIISVDEYGNMNLWYHSRL
jgi:hypothetical protein